MKKLYIVYSAVVLATNIVLLILKIDTSVALAGILLALCVLMLFKNNVIAPPPTDIENRNIETFSLDNVTNKPDETNHIPFVKKFLFFIAPIVLSLLISGIVRIIT